jgi:hypothetical protein
MGRRFTALRVIGTIFKVLAWIALLAGLFGGILILVTSLTLDNQFEATGLDLLGGPITGIAAFVAILVVAILQFLFLYGTGALFYLFLSMEESNRRTAYFTQQMFTASQTNYPLPPTPVDYEE